MTDVNLVLTNNCPQLVAYNMEWSSAEGQPTTMSSTYSDDQSSLYPYTQAAESSEQLPTNSEMAQSQDYSCMFCERSFNLLAKLKRHVAYMHGSDALEKSEKRSQQQRSNKSYKFKCCYCNRNFNTGSHYNFHVRKAHNGLPAVKKQHACMICRKSFDRKLLLAHYCNEHNVKIETENLKFANMDSFQDWKLDIERKTSSRFISSRGKKIYGNATHYFYACNHSGYYTSFGEKSPGTSKINSVCPAGMNVTEADSGECTVAFLKTHVGHSIRSSEVDEALNGLINLGDSSGSPLTPIDARHKSLKKKLIRLLNRISKVSEYDFLEKVVNSAELALSVMNDDLVKNGKASIEINPEVLLYPCHNSESMPGKNARQNAQHNKEVAVTFTLKQLNNH